MLDQIARATPTEKDGGLDAALPRARRGKPSPALSAAITRAILQAATELFLQHGFDGTTLEAVALQTGIPKRTLYKRFPDKAELLRAVLAERVAIWSSVTSRQNAKLTNDLGQRLRTYVATMLVWSTTDEVRAFTRLFASAYGLAGENAIRQHFNGHADMIDLIAHDIAEFGPALGIHCAQPDRLARIIMALVSGWLDTRDSTAAIGQAEAAEQAAILMDVLLRGGAAW